MPLPPPSVDALAHSLNLEALIRSEISDNAQIGFARFMQRALYGSGYGYYISGEDNLALVGIL